MFGYAYYDGFGAILFAVLIVSFLVITGIIYSRLGHQVTRVDILSARLASFLPVFGLIYFINIIVPSGTQVIDILEAIFDGYYLSAFFALLVINLGGPKRTLMHLDEAAKPYKIICSDMGSDPRQFLHTCIWYVCYY